jgi:predicted dehydrogenase
VRETIEKVHEGAVGDIVALQGMYLTGALWSVPRTPQMGEMEYQLRNWLYYTWLSGDHIVEQHIHTLDKMLWMMKDVPPDRATSNGGRTVRTEPQFGNIYDHFDTIYEWDTPRGPVRAFCQTRQWLGADSETSDWAFGTKGIASVMGRTITGETKWRRRPSQVNMYDAEHVALFKAIRGGTPINNGDYMCKSTLMGIMGRTAAYTGKTVFWDKAAAKKSSGPIVRQGTPLLMEMTERLAPASYAWDAKPPESKIAVPGNKSDKPIAPGATEH